VSELDGEHRQGFTGITGVVEEGSATDAAGFFFPSHADEERMQARRLSGMKHGHGTGARRDHPAIGKADPLASVLVEELIADSPVRRLVLAPVGVDLSSYFGGRPSARLFIGHLAYMTGLPSS